jgi:hypothetical protein
VTRDKDITQIRGTLLLGVQRIPVLEGTHPELCTNPERLNLLWCGYTETRFPVGPSDMDEPSVPST